MINFDKIKKIKKLGSGMLGTAYLVKYDNKIFVLKTQKILKSQIKKNLKYPVWREMDFYEYINKLSQNKSIFFMKLLGYRIYNNCNYKPDRPFKIVGKGEFQERLRKLDKSTYCIDTIIEYKGDVLENYLNNNKISKKQMYSFILQLCIIGKILQKGGYSHTDVAPTNMSINKTNKKFIYYNKIKIPTYGYILSLIDYGEVLSNKYKHNNMEYKKYPNKFVMFYDIFGPILDILSNTNKYIVDCKKHKKLLPWEKEGNLFIDTLKKIHINHPKFWKKVTEKYSKIQPKFKKYYKIFDKDTTLKNKTTYPILYQDWALSLVFTEFQLKFPIQFNKYYGWCSYHKFILPKKNMEDILKTTNLDYLIKYSLKHI